MSHTDLDVLQKRTEVFANRFRYTAQAVVSSLRADVSHNIIGTRTETKTTKNLKTPAQSPFVRVWFILSRGFFFVFDKVYVVPRTNARYESRSQDKHVNKLNNYRTS